METPRPFTDSLSVSLAVLALLAVALASFTNALTRQLRVPGEVGAATVVALPLTDTPPPLPLQALARAEPAAKPAPKPRPAPRTAPQDEVAAPELETTPPPPPALAAPQEAVEAAATGPVEPAAIQPPHSPPLDELHPADP